MLTGKQQGPAQIIEANEKNLTFLAKELIRGELVAIPTETVYGLAAVISNEDSLRSLFEVKERPHNDPLIVHIPPILDTDEIFRYLVGHGLCDLSQLSDRVLVKVKMLMEAFWPGPLTFILPKHPKASSWITHQLPTLAVRMPAHPVTQKLIQKVGIPIAAPSANRFGRVSPTSAQDVWKELGTKIPWILDGGRCEIGLESTIIGVVEAAQKHTSEEKLKELVIFRPGGITPFQIQSILGSPIRLYSKKSSSPLAPGMLESHYAPETPLYILPTRVDQLKLDLWNKAIASNRELARALQELKDLRVGLIALSGKASDTGKHFLEATGFHPEVQILSEKGDWTQMAHGFYSAIRTLDEQNLPIIFAESFDRLSETRERTESPNGIDLALANRLSRAGAGKFLVLSDVAKPLYTPKSRAVFKT